MIMSKKKRFIVRLKRLVNRHITLRFFYCKTREYSRRDEVMGISPGITFYFIMGFIPFLIFSVNVILFSTAADIDSVTDMLHVYFPARMADTLEDDINRIVSQRSNLWLWISLFAAAYNFEKGLAILVRASDAKAYGQKGKGSSILKALVSSSEFLVHIKSILYAVGLVISIIISLGLTVFGNILVQIARQNFNLSPIFLDIWNITVYGIPFIVLIAYLTIFYLSAPRSYTPRFLHAISTAFIVTTLWLIATIVYRWMLMIIPNIGESYGPLFGLFTMFGWFYYIVTIIIAGLCFIKSLIIFQHKLDIITHAYHKNVKEE